MERFYFSKGEIYGAYKKTIADLMIGTERQSNGNITRNKFRRGPHRASDNEISKNIFHQMNNFQGFICIYGGQTTLLLKICAKFTY